ncbi:hypothetical protein HN371_28765 [Candidatus Poribacteria bacterium]|jgi:hypothetical protein|nr:hypothetical protein [Candidatus Poribacteria bacterium]MBT5531733.1 hypothetical protein [Candidatus Poribacteria bacterium]MBT5714737.1 hypothetical protein [Candidatus Poribacteria bacterium]MBT7095824.1 hypothetical protein [Candidatus Poribacteria bacterium]
MYHQWARDFPGAACLLALALMLWGCGGDGDAPGDGPLAQVLRVVGLDFGPQDYRYGTEIRVVFDRDPGDVQLDYDGDQPIADIAGRGTTRAFLLERSPTVLRWGRGGLLVLEYDPIEPAETNRVPPVPIDPLPGATDVDGGRLARAGVRIRLDRALVTPGLIPVHSVEQAVITGSDGTKWEPAMTVTGQILTLVGDAAHPYRSGVTYRVSVRVVNRIAPGLFPPTEYEFTVK